MIENELRRHQWKAFRRHPMFERNLGVKIFMCVCFGFLALEFFVFGLLLDNFCLEVGNYASPIDCFNSGLLYILVIDFVAKFFMKTSQSMQISPYLTMPIKRNKLFNFLQIKEFASMWNWYIMFLVVPFALKVVPREYPFLHVFVYLIFIYILFIMNSLLIALTKSWVKTGLWKISVPAAIIAGIAVAAFKFDFSFGDYTQQFAGSLLNLNPIAWAAFIGVFVFLWYACRWQMRAMIYREMQGEKVKDSMSFSNMTFLDRFGEIGEYINLELKLIFRNKRMKNQFYTVVFLIVTLGFQLVMNKVVNEESFMKLFFVGFMLGGFGMIFSQFLFMAESSYFDGLMSRKHSFFSMMKAKYYFYCVISFVIYVGLMIFVWARGVALSYLFVTSVFFYYIGLVYFCFFQNGVYNKAYFDLADSGFMSWRSSSVSTMAISMLSMFVPVVLFALIRSLTSEDIACYFMLAVGLTFVLGSNVWLKWTYNRIMKKRYIIMEGFRN